MTISGVPTLNPVAGFSNAPIDSFGAKFPAPLWPGSFYTFFDDFTGFRGALAAAGLADWLITPTGSAVAPVVTDAFGGIVSVVTPATDNAGNSMQWQGGNALTDVAETFTFLSGKELFFAARFSLSEVIQSDLVIGLVVADTDPFTAFTDGVAFVKADGSAVLNLTSAIVTPASATVAVATLVNGAFIEVGFHYNGVDAITAYVNGNRAGSLGISALPTTELAVTFGMQAGEAAIKTALFDWIYAARER